MVDMTGSNLFIVFNHICISMYIYLYVTQHVNTLFLLTYFHVSDDALTLVLSVNIYIVLSLSARVTAITQGL